MTTLREKIDALEAERAELEVTEVRLKTEMEAEQNEKIVADDQIAALAHFHEIVAENAGNLEAIKALLPRFVDYVGFYAEEKGEGKLEVALFPDPIVESADVVSTGDSPAPPLQPGGGPAGPRFAAESQMVGPAGFEPATSCTPSKRASQAALRPDAWSAFAPPELRRDRGSNARL